MVSGTSSRLVRALCAALVMALVVCGCSSTSYSRRAVLDVARDGAGPIQESQTQHESKMVFDPHFMHDPFVYMLYVFSLGINLAIGPMIDGGDFERVEIVEHRDVNGKLVCLERIESVLEWRNAKSAMLPFNAARHQIQAQQENIYSWLYSEAMSEGVRTPGRTLVSSIGIGGNLKRAAEEQKASFEKQNDRLSWVPIEDSGLLIETLGPVMNSKALHYSPRTASLFFSVPSVDTPDGTDGYSGFESDLSVSDRELVPELLYPKGPGQPIIFPLHRTKLHVVRVFTSPEGEQIKVLNEMYEYDSRLDNVLKKSPVKLSHLKRK